MKDWTFGHRNNKNHNLDTRASFLPFGYKILRHHSLSYRKSKRPWNRNFKNHIYMYSPNLRYVGCKEYWIFPYTESVCHIWQYTVRIRKLWMSHGSYGNVSEIFLIFNNLVPRVFGIFLIFWSVKTASPSSQIKKIKKIPNALGTRLHF